VLRHIARTTNKDAQAQADGQPDVCSKPAKLADGLRPSVNVQVRTVLPDFVDAEHSPTAEIYRGEAVQSIEVGCPVRLSFGHGDVHNDDVEAGRVSGSAELRLWHRASEPVVVGLLGLAVSSSAVA
jgi:hypothetical protein